MAGMLSRERAILAIEHNITDRIPLVPCQLLNCG